MICGSRRFARCRAADLAALTCVLAITICQALRASSYFTLCYVDCGEVFISELQVRNVDLFGIQFGLLENHATSPMLGDHPFLYTHSVNLGSLVALLLRGLGVSSFESRQAAVLGVFALGLWVAYTAVRRLAPTGPTALCCLILLGSSSAVFNYALHGLRVWHTTAVFGVVWLVAVSFETGPILTWRIIAAVTAVAVVAFGIGYEFWAMHLLMIGVSWLLTWAVFTSPERARQGPRLWTMAALIVTINAAVFAGRQVHVLATLGIEFWRTDFLYSVGHKIPGMSYLLHLPPPEDIEHFYSSFRVLRPPANPITAANLPDTLDLLRTHFLFSPFPKLGLLTILLVAGFLALAVLKAAKAMILLEKSTAGTSSSGSLFPRCAVAVGGLVAGSVLGGLAFIQMWIDHYVAHFHPLLIFPCVLVTGYVVAHLLQLAVSAKTERKTGFAAMAVTMAFILLLSHVVVQLENQRSSHSIDVSWIGELRRRASASFAISYFGAAAAFATHGSVLELTPASVSASLPRLARQQAPFTADMVPIFYERDRRDAERYLAPDFWLYFPSDRRTDSWARRPVCRFDWMTRNVLPLVQAVTLSLVPQKQSIPVQRGNVATLSRRVLDNRRDVEAFDLLLDGEVVGESLYNCVFGTLIARIPISQSAAPGLHVVSIIARLKDGGSIEAGTAEITITESETTAAQKAQNPESIDMQAVHSMPQPGVDDIRRRYPDLPIAASRTGVSRDDGFIIFDLRGRHRQN